MKWKPNKKIDLPDLPNDEMVDYLDKRCRQAVWYFNDNAEKHKRGEFDRIFCMFLGLSELKKEYERKVYYTEDKLF